MHFFDRLGARDFTSREFGSSSTTSRPWFYSYQARTRGRRRRRKEKQNNNNNNKTVRNNTAPAGSYHPSLSRPLLLCTHCFRLREMNGISHLPGEHSRTTHTHTTQSSRFTSRCSCLFSIARLDSRREDDSFFYHVDQSTDLGQPLPSSCHCNVRTEFSIVALSISTGLNKKERN